MEFYDQLALDYDQMTGFDVRLEKEIEIFRVILKRFPAKTILDAGCGTGFHTVVLSRLNKEVTGIDNSEAMLTRAQENCRHWQVSPQFINADFLNFSHKIQTSFDAIFCLGNSFAHLLTVDLRLKVLQNFKRSLTAGGYIFLQIMNYDKILIQRPHIFSIKEYDQVKYIRSYQYLPSTILFSVRIETPSGDRELTNELYPLQSDELYRLAVTSGFNNIIFFGDLSLSGYETTISDNICVLLSL